MEDPNKKLDSWDSFVSGTFLKAGSVQSENDPYVCVGIESVSEKDGSERPRITLERNAIQYDFDLNQTNTKKLMELGIKSPREVIGKKIYFKKALARNPKTNIEVDSLRIWKIE